MPTLRRAALFAASGAAALALVTACGSSGSSSGAGSATPAPPASSASSAPANPSSPAAPAGQTVLQTAGSATLGTIVTDGSGYTLYRFDKDTAKPSMSNCNGACATLWPPVAAVDNAQVKGVDKALVGTVTRADGSKQLTLNGWPLYRYSPDTKPGDTKGQGVGGTWYASTPQGKKAAVQTPASPSPTPSSGGGGYGY